MQIKVCNLQIVDYGSQYVMHFRKKLSFPSARFCKGRQTLANLCQNSGNLRPPYCPNCVYFHSYFRTIGPNVDWHSLCLRKICRNLFTCGIFLFFNMLCILNISFRHQLSEFHLKSSTNDFQLTCLMLPLCLQIS